MPPNVGSDDPRYTTLSSEERIKYLKKNKKQISMDSDGNIWYEAQSTTNLTGLKDLFNISEKEFYKNNPDAKKSGAINLYQKYKVDNVKKLEVGSEAIVLSDFMSDYKQIEKRKGWFEKNGDNISTDGKSIYYTPDDGTTLGGLKKLFNLQDANSILKMNDIKKIQEGKTIKVENVDELEELEQNFLQPKIDYAKKRAGWFEKNGENISVKDEKVYYTPEDGTTLGNIALLFDIDKEGQDKILAQNGMKSAKEIKIGKPVEICDVKELDVLEKKIIVDKVQNLSQKNEELEEFTITSWDDIKSNLKLTKGLDLSEKGSEYIKGREAAKVNSKGYEVYHGEADEKGVLTVAHGHAKKNKIKVNGKVYYEGDTISLNEGEMLFSKDTKRFISLLSKHMKKGSKLSANQKDAAISYAFNTGGEKLVKNKNVKVTFAELLSQGRFDEAQGKFNIIDSNNSPTKGLAKRRIEELAIFSDGYLSKEGLELLENRLMGKFKGEYTKSDIRDIMIRVKKYGISNADEFEKTLTKIMKKHNGN